MNKLYTNNSNLGTQEHCLGRKKRVKRCVIDDGFNSELVETAFFDGILEIPKLEAPKEIVIPENLIPFTKRNSSKNFSETLAFYENDIKFSNIATVSEHLQYRLLGSVVRILRSALSLSYPYILALFLYGMMYII